MTEARPVVWSAAALLDLNNIFAYHNRRDPVAARRLMRRIHDAAGVLAAHPGAGAVAPDLEPAGLHRQVVVRPYRVIYRVDSDRVYLLRVWDSRGNREDLAPGE